MLGKILVALRWRDRVDGIIPYIEKLVTPGMRVVFLIRYPLDLRQYLRDHWISTESARAAIAAGKELSQRYGCEAQRELAEKRLAPAREALQKMQVDLEIRLYSGSFRAAMQDGIVAGDVLWVVVPARRSSWSGWLWKRAMASLGPLRPDEFPVILQDPNSPAQRYS